MESSSTAGLREHLKSPVGLFFSLILIIPVYALYQLGILIQLAAEDSHSFSFNGADLFTSRILRLFGGSLLAYALFVLLLTFVFIIILRRLRTPERLHPLLLLWVLAESLLYALLLGSTIHLILGLNTPNTLWMKIFHAFGAGFNEELIFRLGILGGIVLIASWFRIAEAPAVVVAVVVSSLLFSAFHYIGPFAHPLTLDSFMFRFLAGVYLAMIYWWRGLAVAVYSHVLYDLYFFVIVS